MWMGLGSSGLVGSGHLSGLRYKRFGISGDMGVVAVLVKLTSVANISPPKSP